MESVRSLARACRAVPLVLLVAAGCAAALDAFVVNQVTWESHDGRLYLGDGRGQFADSAQRPAGHLPVVGEHGAVLSYS